MICNLYFHWMFLELYDTCNIDIIAFVNVTCLNHTAWLESDDVVLLS